MRQWRHIFDDLNRDSCRLQPGDRTLTTSAWALYTNFNLFDAVLGCTLGTYFSSSLSSKRSALTTALKPRSAGGCPAEHIAAGIGNRDQGVVECGFHMRNRLGDILSNLFSFRFRHRTYFQDSGNVRQRTTDKISASYPLRPSSPPLSSSHLYVFEHWFVFAGLEQAGLDDAEYLDSTESL